MGTQNGVTFWHCGINYYYKILLLLCYTNKIPLSDVLLSDGTRCNAKVIGIIFSMK
jgi:hypothetical protein